MTVKRVIVLESEKLLNAGVYSLLSSNGHLEVFGLTLNDQEFFDVAEAYQPDVVIMDDRFLDRNMDSYVAFLRRLPKLRTIVFDIGTNDVQVCDRRLVHVRHLDDFLDQI